MSLYNMLFGRNPQSDLLLAVIGLKRNDVERFRDVFAAEDGSEIHVYTRTGGGNRDDYPNQAMRERPEWISSEDDDFDCTYCTDRFKVPEQWRADVKGLANILENGLRPEFGRHLLATLQRPATEGDKETAAYEAEQARLHSLPHFMANGHTFVPQSDHAMEEALKLAEARGGELRSCWGIAPLSITVKRDFQPCPGAKDERERGAIVRVEAGYDYAWKVDEDYWKHCEERFAASYPLSMAKIREKVEQLRTRTRK